MEEKLNNLKGYLKQYNSAVIAFSGGVDRTFLAKVAKDIYGDKLLLITATSSTYPFYELEEAKSLAGLLEINHRIIVSEELDIPGYSDNPPDRYYYPKSELFGKIKYISSAEGFKAKKEPGVISPLAETGFTDKEKKLNSGHEEKNYAKSALFLQ